MSQTLRAFAAMRTSIAAGFFLLAATLMVAAVACQGPSGESTEGQVVARLSVPGQKPFEITTASVDAHILALPVAERPRPGQDLDAWYSDQIRELAIEHLLRAEAAASGLREDASFAAGRHEAEEQIAVQLCFAELNPGIDQISEEDLRAAFDARGDSFSAPERRSVYQIFLRREPQARAKIRKLRDRVLAGESFQRLATEYSESETRHRQGSLSWIVRGELPAGFEKVIFGLQEGVPSEPVATREGFHLFYVDQILPPRQLSFEEARPILHERLVAQRREAAMAELEKGVEVPAGAVILDRAGFAEMFRAGDPKAVVLHIGDTELTLADLRRHLHQAQARQQEGAKAPPAVDLAWQILEVRRRRELVYRHCQATHHIPEEKVQARLETWEQEAMLAAQRQRRLIEVAKRDEARLSQFYESNLGSFSKPPAWHLRRLRIPLDAQSGTVMARLEAAASRHDSKLEALQRELGGEIEDLGFQTLNDLRRQQPKLPPLVAPLAAGQLAAPYRSSKFLEVVEVVARRDAEPLPFDTIADRIAAAYVSQYTREVYQQLSDELLRGDNLQILPEGLAALRAAGLPAQDVSVDQLESLLEEI